MIRARTYCPSRNFWSLFGKRALVKTAWSPELTCGAIKLILPRDICAAEFGSIRATGSPRRSCPDKFIGTGIRKSNSSF
jgi:hypothetical protein